MLKGALFGTGLVCGVYLGIYLREAGFDQDLTIAYYSMKKEKAAQKIQALEAEKLAMLYQQNVYNDKHFMEFVDRAKKNGEKIDEIITDETAKFIQSDSFRDFDKSYQHFNQKSENKEI